MGTIEKQLVREIMSKNKNYSVNDVYDKLKEMFGSMIQELLEAEMSTQLGYEKNDRENKEIENCRNGHRSKTVKSIYGDVEIQVPRDQNSEFEPQIVKKHQRDVSGIEEKIISLYAHGMTTRDISEQINSLYGFELSHDMVSKITDKILPNLKEWQARPLESVYTFVFMDAIHYKIKTDGQIKNCAAYVVIGVNKEGLKDVLGIWIGEAESAKFWLGVMTELKNRGVNDILIFCVDGLTGMENAINAAYPKAIIQRCIIHQLRNSLKYVSYKDLKAIAADFKVMYNSATEEAGYYELEKLEQKWGKVYPKAIKSWKDNWEILSPFFKYPAEIRKIMYTTNIIEGLHRQFRKVTKTKTIFPNDQSLEKMLYLATQNIMKKWTMRFREWDKIINHLEIMFEGRI